MCFKMTKRLQVVMISCLLLWGSLQGDPVQAQGSGAEGKSEASVTFYYGEKQPPDSNPESDKTLKADTSEKSQSGFLPQTGESKSYLPFIGLLCISFVLICLIASKKNRCDIYIYRKL